MVSAEHKDPEISQEATPVDFFSFINGKSDLYLVGDLGTMRRPDEFISSLISRSSRALEYVGSGVNVSKC
jgi:hypothetical protein